MSDFLTLKRKKPPTPPCLKLNSPSWIFTNWESVLNLETRHFELERDSFSVTDENEKLEYPTAY